MATPALPPIAQMMDLILGHYRTAAISTAARLRLADHLATGPKTAAELAELSSANPDSISRLARALASINVFAVEGDRFSLTPLGETIRMNEPGSIGHVAAMMTDPVHWGGWSAFLDTVREGSSQVKQVLGGTVWEYYQKHPELELGFSNAMSAVSNLAIPAVLAGYDFSSSRTIVDVGGAHGALVASVLKEHKAAKGIVVDQPAVVAEAPKTIRSNFPADVTDRLSWVAGNFFAVGSIPAGDTYLLKHILHDWDDEHSVLILKAIRASMQPGSKLLIVELALPEQPAHSPAFWMDLNMMALVNGRERTASQYEVLLQQAGLTTASFTAGPPSPVGLLVAVPV